MSSQELKELIGKLVKMEGSVSWLAFQRRHVIGCIIDAEYIESCVHVWVHWADGIQTWERLSDNYITLVNP